VDAPYSADGKLAVALDDTDVAGMYEAVLKQKKGGKEETRHYAVNVDPAEGNLKTLWAPELAVRLKDAECEFHQAATFRYAGEERPGSNLSLTLLYVLIVLLVGEQLLAYWASYHPPASGRAGGATYQSSRLGRSESHPQQRDATEAEAARQPTS
jgi:hypothetical protein